MNVNKVQLRSKIEIKEESALKCMQFATEYMLKKAEYRLLNPLHFDDMKREQIDQQAKIMAQLCTFSTVFVEKPINKSIKKSKLSNASTTKKDSSLLDEIYGPELNSKISSQLKKSALHKIKPIQSYMVEESFGLKEQSKSIPPKPTQLDFSSDEEVKSNASSKKSKSKFEKVIPPPKKSIFKPQQFLSQQANFKKKSNISTPSFQEQKNLNESPIIKQIQSDSNSDDSFDNFPLNQSQKDKNDASNFGQKTILKTQDFHSYRSSTFSDAQKKDIDVVSEHASQNDISYVSNVRKKGSVKEDGSRVVLEESSSSRIVLKQSVFSQTHQQPIEKSIETEEIPIPVQPVTQNLDQIPPLYQQTSQQTPDQQVPSREQINTYLMKLESFEVQQSILLRKLTKIWSQQSRCIKSIKKIKWEDFQLPKPTFNIKTYQYANVIE